MLIDISLYGRYLPDIFIQALYQAPQLFIFAGRADIGEEFFQLLPGTFILEILPEKISDPVFHHKVMC
jgi:hypothetical protein